jgi:polysaccharide biosynthesis/export protein
MMSSSFERNVFHFGGWAALIIAACACAPSFAQQAQQAAAGQALADYALNAGDELEVAVWKEPDLTKVVVVRPDGKFSIPLAGDVAAAGRSVTQVQTEIATRLKKYIPEPVVTVTVTKLTGNIVYVIGQVNKPGQYVMNPRLNVVQALSVAGGMTPFAALNDIIVLRGPAGTQRVLPFRYAEVNKGRNLNQNLALEAGDVIIVP